MSGSRPLALALAVALMLLPSCSSDRPLGAGLLEASDPTADALYAKATAAEQSGKTKSAIKLYGKIAKDHPYAEVAPQALFRRASILESEGELIKAFDAFQELIQRHTNSSLYAEALKNQEIVAQAAANGVITNNFFGIKSRLDSKRTTEMLTKVRNNAPRAPSAPRAQFSIGEVWERREDATKAVAAYQELVDEYPASKEAPEAQYRIGYILLNETARGNRNQANLDRSRHAFEDLLQRYPNSARANDARERLQEIGGRDIQRSLDIAEFYDKKGETSSAIFYYEEVLRKTSSGPLHARATLRLQELQGDNP